MGTAALVVATGGIGAACVPGLIAATAGGALIGAGGDVVGQMIANGSMDLSQIDWGSVALSGLSGGATGLLSATGAGPAAMGIMGGVSSGSSEIYHQMQTGEDINWGQVAVRTLGGAVSGAVLGNVGSQTASGAKEIAKNAGKVFLANGGVSFAENLTYNLMGGEDLGTAAKQASFSALISGGTSAGFYALGQAAKNMCFVEGTMVLTAAGLVAIESIAVGDMVIATDPETGETAEKQVKNTFVNETEELAHVFVDDEEIVCTPGHKFYAPEKGWTSAIKLRAGDHLQLVNGEYVTVEKVQHELLEEPVKIYNFEVEDFHTYYVGTDAQVLVHNMCKNLDLSTGEGYDAGDDPVRIEGDWSLNDMKQALLGHSPDGLGNPDIHHGGQMPGAAKHEVLPSDHRHNNALHPNKHNQGVTAEMRSSDRQLHWWYRAREQGADELLPDWIYDNVDSKGNE